MQSLENADIDALDDEDEDDAMDIGSLGEFAYGLNDAHFIRFQRRGPSLLVSFEVAGKNATLDQHVLQQRDLAEDMQWSTLTLTSKGDTWFRAPEVIQFFDALVDGTLLDQFDDVLFYGQGSGGHGALSLALTAPNARILALAPHFGFGVPGAPEDDRFAPPVDLDFTSRYAISPENLAAAQNIWLLFDPNIIPDRAHARAIGAGTALMCRNMGSDVQGGLNELGLLEELIVRAMEGELESVAFYQALRVRRDDPAWLRRLIGRLIDENRPVLEALAVRNVAQRTGRHRFTKRFEQIEADLRAKGVTVPASRFSGA